jgi:DNA-binding transcriptional LysR family regulator
MDLDVRHLRLIVAIADAGSLSAAARVLGLQQPTVSTQLRRIEESLGGPLFERSASGVHATARGVGVLRRARPILERLEHFDDRPSDAAHPGTVRVRTFVLPFEAFLPLLEQLAPGIRWEARTGGVADGADAVADGDADLYFGLWWMASTAPPGVVVDEVLNERAWVLLPADHPCAGEPAVSLRSLSRETWVSRPEPELYRSLLKDCRRAGFEPNVQFRVVDEATLLSVVGAGAGVALTSPIADTGGAVVARPCSDAEGHSWVLAYHPDRVPPGLVRMLGDLVRWGYSFKARGNDELRTTLPPELAHAPFPEPYRP